MTLERPMFPPKSQQPSRRAVVSGVAALPLIASAAFAQAAGSSPSRPDLAARFEDLYSRFSRQWQEDDRQVKEFERICFERTGIIFQGFGSGRSYPRGYIEARKAVVQAFPDPDSGDAGWLALSAEAADLAAEILQMKPASLADIVLQARVCALENQSFWRDRTAVDTMDGGERAYRLLVDRICEFGGTTALPGAAVQT